MASGFLNPPQWDEKSKDFTIWLREVKAWKLATAGVTGLKDVHGLQLALHLPEGSEIRNQIFDTIDTDEMHGDDGWNKVIDLIEGHYKKDESTSAFQTWKAFRTLTRKSDQNIDQYIMYYEKYKTKMRRFKMDLGEQIHGLNILCGAGLSDDELRIAMREVNIDDPDNMYEQAKKALKKYFGSSSITNTNDDKITIKQEAFFVNEEDYQSFISWKQTRKNENFQSRSQNRLYKGGYERSQAPILKKTNPKDFKGNPLKCHICKSITHFARNCPHKEEIDDVHFTKASDDEIIECDITDTRISHTLNHMIIDTGCPRNVAGLTWTKCFLDSLDTNMKALVKKSSSRNKFKFGGGKPMSSLYTLNVPIMIAGTLTNLTFDVVDTELPLLLGKFTMKEWCVVIYTENDTAEITINGEKKTVELYTSTSGHWCINIQPSFPVEAISTLFSVSNMSYQQKKSAARHLHRQYCHPPYEFLEKVLKVFDENDEEFLQLLKQHSDKCDVCKRYKPTIPRPAVGNLFDPDKMRFNQYVSIDLKHRNGKYILYMIDMVTRYTRACYVQDKEKGTVVNKIIELWLPIFGAADTFHMDNGGEFANDEMRELGNRFGIRIKHTPAYSPWSNGLNERNHATIDLMMSKILEDMPDVPEEVALQYAVAIRNCCMYVHGFTPAQLAIGQNPKLPSSINDHLPAREDTTTSSLIAQHLNTIALARKAFTKAETSAKLRKALKHPVRQYADVVYQPGDRVYYKLSDDRRWQGEATVIGVDGKVVIVRHGSVIRRVHICRLQLVLPSNDLLAYEPDEIAASSQVNKDESSTSSADTIPEELLIPDGSEQSHLPGEITLPNAKNADPPVCPADRSQIEVSSTKSVPAANINPVKIPKRHEVVKFKYPDDTEWKEVTVLGPAGSRRGIYKNWVNVKNDSSKWSMDWSDVEDWHTTAPVSSIGEEVVNTDHSDVEKSVDNDVTPSFNVSKVDEFFVAKEEELEKWRLFNVYKEVKDVGQERLTGRWVCTKKSTSNGDTSLKARYVVKGFQEHSSVQSDSPTGSKESMRILLMLSACNNWKLHY